MAKKYIDADLLRKEIEKWKSLFSKEKEKKDASIMDKLSLGGRIAMLEEILVLIAPLWQEKPIDLEKEIRRYLKEECSEDDEPSVSEIARHFYELGKGSQPQLPADVEEAAEKHIQEVRDAAGHPGWEWETQDVRDAFKAGAEWQAERLLKGSPTPEDTVLFNKGVAEGRRLERQDMLKDAVEGEIEEVSFNNGELHNTIFFSFKEESLLVENRIWFPRCGKDGDKVKIVIVKEDKK